MKLAIYSASWSEVAFDHWKLSCDTFQQIKFSSILHCQLFIFSPSLCSYSAYPFSRLCILFFSERKWVALKITFVATETDTSFFPCSSSWLQAWHKWDSWLKVSISIPLLIKFQKRKQMKNPVLFFSLSLFHFLQVEQYPN